MHRYRLATLGIAALLATAAVAQEIDSPGLTDLFACRLDDQQVALSFKFDASPCWQAGEAQVSPADGDSASVTIPTSQTAEICTKNIVVADYGATLAVDPAVHRLAVTINDPQGQLIGTGTAAIAEPGGGCAKPEEQAPAPAEPAASTASAPA